MWNSTHTQTIYQFESTQFEISHCSPIKIQPCFCQALAINHKGYYPSLRVRFVGKMENLKDRKWGEGGKVGG